MAKQVDARKEKLGPGDAVRLAREASSLWVAKGKKVVYFDMKRDNPSDAELKKVMLGPSGTLRAPTMRRGKKLFVGFEPEQFASEFLA